MLSQTLALQLQEAGLPWQPDLFDFFVIPVPGLEDRYFVITDMLVDRGIVQGWPALTFNGAAEWALDYILQSDAIWVPTEEQLRKLIFERSGATSQTVTCGPGTCSLTLQVNGREHTFAGPTLADVLGKALLYFLTEGRTVSP